MLQYIDYNYETTYIENRKKSLQNKCKFFIEKHLNCFIIEKNNQETPYLEFVGHIYSMFNIYIMCVCVCIYMYVYKCVCIYIYIKVQQLYVFNKFIAGPT